MNKVTRIDRELFDSCRGDKSRFKALAFAIRFKALVPSSTFKGYTQHGMASLMRCSTKSVSKFMGILEGMGLVRWFERDGVRFMSIRPLRHRKELRSADRNAPQGSGKQNYYTPKNLDVVLDYGCIDRLNMTMTTHILQQYALIEMAKRKAYYRDSIRLTKSEKRTSRRRDNHPKRACGAVPEERKRFADYGISFGTIAKNMGCGRTTAAKLIKDAQMRNFVLVCKRKFYGTTEEAVNKDYMLDCNFHVHTDRAGRTVVVATNIYFPLMGNADWGKSLREWNMLSIALAKQKREALRADA